MSYKSSNLNSYMYQRTDLFPQDPTCSSVHGSLTGVERIIKSLHSFCRRTTEIVKWNRIVRNVLLSAGQRHILTSALCISALIFITLLTDLLHTKSVGLASASRTSEATIQSSKSPVRTHKHTLTPRSNQPAQNKPIKVLKVFRTTTHCLQPCPPWSLHMCSLKRWKCSDVS